MTSPAEAEDISEEELAELEADISEAELAEAEAATASGSDPELDAEPAAPAPEPEPAPAPAPEPEPAPAPVPAPAFEPVDLGPVAEIEVEPESAPNPLLAFVQRSPALSFVLVFLVVLSPFLITSFQRRAREQRVTAALNTWEQNLASAGLPVPFLAKQDVPPPLALTKITPEEIEAAGFAQRYAELSTWSAMLDRRKPEGDLGEEGFGAALAACNAYRQAAPQGTSAPLLRRARTLTNKAPELLRPTLSLFGDLFAGQHQQVIHRVEGILKAGGVHPSCVAALEVLHIEATTRRVRSVLSLRPPPTEDLEELRGYVGTQGVDVGALLDEHAASLGDVLGAGNNEVPRVRALVELLVATHPDGFAEGSRLEKAWPAFSATAGEALKRALSSWEDDSRQVAEVLALTHRLDPKLELIPSTTFRSWRDHLQQVVDDPVRLLAFARRFLELGHSPAGLEELLATHTQGKRPAADRAESSPGYLMLDSIIVANTGGIDTIRARQAKLDALLGDRQDRAATRIRARFAHLRGRAAVEAGAWDEGEQQLARAEELGFEPSFRLLRTRSRCALGRGDPEQAVELAREQVKGIELHAARVRGTKGDATVVWEISGYPVHPNLLDPLRAECHLDLAELVVGSNPAEATKICERVKALDRRNPRLQLVQARAFMAQGKRNQARKVVFDGIRALQGRPGQETLRKRLQELLKELGPN